MNTLKKNNVLSSLLKSIRNNSDAILEANAKDIKKYKGGDQAMYDRLKIDDSKVDGMIRSVQEVVGKLDPVNVELYRHAHAGGMGIVNRTAPFGTILIIYESRPDVTIEASILAYKAGNRILLKGGKEARHSNLALVKCWHEALEENEMEKDWIQYLDYPREKTQAFLKNPNLPVDLIVPRGGEKLIAFVKKHASCPVLVSGRGNNFLYIHEAADWEIVERIILNAKTQKISACNALDKVLIDKDLPDLKKRVCQLVKSLKKVGVELRIDSKVAAINQLKGTDIIEDESVWYEEFLAMKLAIGVVKNVRTAIKKINKYSGGHSASILTESPEVATYFMEHADVAVVYHNASTRFTDGGEFGMGAEMAISTDKLHHRGPLGLDHLVSNKWFVYGSGQVRS
ncbi:MAG: glutamate-5-semialdehyde dehydrogenase [Bacteroidetes bacterium]|nr:glutamate-5-semialdehyde dehydrogenase [Bacteroidota bacterium]